MDLNIVHLGNDIYLAKGFIPTDALAAITQGYDACAFEKIRPHVGQEYYKAERMAETHWVQHNTPLDALIGAQVRRSVSFLHQEYDGALQVMSDEGFRLNRYPVGCDYAQHVDKSSTDIRYLRQEVSLILNLNDDYEGGELVFERQGLKIKLGKGDLVIFPSGYTHPHSVQAITAGTRKSIVTWLGI